MFERCLYFNINAAARHINRVWDQAYEEFNLSPSHAYLLRLVLANPGMSQQWIAEELQLEKSTIARFIVVMENKGFLYRHKAGREQFVFPSEKATAIGQQLTSHGDELYRRITACLGRDKVVQLVADLKRVADTAL